MKLKELGEYYIGLTYKPEDVTDDGTIVLRSGNIQEGKFDLSDIVRVKTKIRDKLYVRPGDVLMCSRNGSARLVGKSTVIPKLEEPMTFGAFMTIFRTPYNDYLRYFLQSNDFRRQLSNSKTTTINQITINMLDNIDIELPEESIREERCKKLELIQCVIDARKKELDMLDELIKARFVEMFGDPRTNPKGLELKTLDQLGSWNSGGTPSRTKPEYFTGDINWYSAGELNSLYLNGSIEKITEDAINESAAKLFKAGSLLVGMYDTAAFKMGILREDSASNQACACIEPNDKVDIVWLYYALTMIKDYYLSQRRGVRQKNLNLGMIRAFELPIAKKESQIEFVSFVKQVDKSKVVVQKALDETKVLFDSLMQEYFGG